MRRSAAPHTAAAPAGERPAASPDTRSTHPHGPDQTPAAHAGSCAAPAAPQIRPSDNSPAGLNDDVSRKGPRPKHTPEPFYQPSNMEAPRRSIDEMQQGKTVTKTLEELTALEED